jgi:hypothetical protein
MKRLLAIGLTAGLVSVATGCTSPAQPTPASSAPAVSGVSIGEFATPAIGQSVQLTATVTLSDGTRKDATAQAAWRTSNPSTATVSGTGVLVAVAPGEVDISATYNGVAGQRSIVIVRPSPPPEARLSVRIDSIGSPAAVAALSPISFDARASTGDALSYRIEFGDGQASTQMVAIHPVDVGGDLTARLTVTDHAGRTSSTARSFTVLPLAFGTADVWYYAEPILATHFLRFDFITRHGVEYDGTVTYGYEPNQRFAKCHATLSGERDIRIAAPDLGLQFRGYLDLHQLVLTPQGGYTMSGGRLVLTQSGGTDDGRVWTLSYAEGP